MADEIEWITVNHVHIPIKPGQSKDEAVKEFTDEQERKKAFQDKSVEELVNLAKNKNHKNQTEPILIGKVNFVNETQVFSILEDYEKKLFDLPYEASITVTTDGNVWRVDGSYSSVDTTIIPHSLEGSYSYHNHPKDATWYSFSADDVDFFLTQKEQCSIASDDKYVYRMVRTAKTSIDAKNIQQEFENAYYLSLEKSFNKDIDIDIDGYHEALILLSEKYNFEYERIKK